MSPAKCICENWPQILISRKYPDGTQWMCHIYCGECNTNETWIALPKVSACETMRRAIYKWNIMIKEVKHAKS